MNRKCLFFSLLFFSLYLTQLVLKREDWPFTAMSLFSGGHYNTQDTYKIEVLYDLKEKPNGEWIDPLLLGSDKFFIIESLTKLIIQNNQVNNDTKESRKFLVSNIYPILKRNNIQPGGQLKIRIRHWNLLTYQSYTQPDRDFIYLSEVVSYE